ncbi:MAG: HD domain-containing protein [Bacteroidales bacterium]
MDPLSIIKKYYPENSEIYHVLVDHSRLVADKALELAARHPELNPDMNFIEEAAMLHDIGIFLCNAPEIACTGSEPYIRHGVLGAEILRKEGLERHALVCERHTGSGITREQIESQQLPLPARDMLPVSTEEKLICLADKFYSKSHPGKEKSIEKIRKSMARFGDDALIRFDEMCRLFL